MAVVVFVLPKHRLEHPSVQARMGGLYAHFNIKMRSNRALLLVFVLKRMLLVFFILYQSHSVGNQYLMVAYISLASFIYVSTQRPYVNSTFNKQVMFQEYMILNLATSLVLFTPFCPDPLTRYDLGWLYLIMMSVFILIGLAQSSLLPIIRRIVLLIIKFYRLMRMWFRKCKNYRASKLTKTNQEDSEDTENPQVELDAEYQFYKNLITELEAKLRNKQLETMLKSRQGEMDLCREDMVQLGSVTADEVGMLTTNLLPQERCRLLREHKMVDYILDMVPSFAKGPLLRKHIDH